MPKRSSKTKEPGINWMKYAEWIKQGLFVGSKVIEAGCKTIVG